MWGACFRAFAFLFNCHINSLIWIRGDFYLKADVLAAWAECNDLFLSDVEGLSDVGGLLDFRRW